MKKRRIRLGLPENAVPNPERQYQVYIHSPRFRDFQERLGKIAEANGSYRIHFDYLWYVGHVFCREDSKDCQKCWVQSVCSSK